MLRLCTSSARSARLLLLAAACAPGPAPGEGSEDSGGDDGADPAANCTRSDGLFSDVVVEQAAVATVLRVRWTTSRPTRGSVAFTTPEGATVRTPPGVLGFQHEALVVGLPAETGSTLVPIAEDGGAAWCGPTRRAETGPLDPSLPALHLDAVDPTLLDGGFVLVPLLQPQQAWITVLDSHGRYVWTWPVATGWVPPGSPVFRVEVSPDGQGLLFNTQGERSTDPGYLTFVSWDGETTTRRPVPGGHTDFALLPDGGFAMLGWTVREFEGGRRLLGDTVLEVSADGAVREVWDAFDHFEPDLSVAFPTGFLAREPELEDWSHVNGISYDPAEDDLLVTITVNDSVARIDRATGEQAWVAGPGGDFALPAQDAIEQPHSAEAVPGGILVFNRGDWYGGTTCSRAVELSLDPARREAAEAWSYAGDRCEHVGLFGSAARLPSGGTLVSWSILGMLDVADDEGRTAWRAQLGLGAAFGFARYAPSLYSGSP